MNRPLLTLFSILVFSQSFAENIPFIPDETLEGIFAKRPIVPDAQVLQLLNTSTSKSMDTTTIKLTVWNIYKGKKPGLGESLVNFVAASDVVMIQEWIQTPVLINLAKSFINANATMAAGFWNKDDFMTGVMTTAKANPTHTEWIRSDYVEPFIKTPKMVLMTEYYFEKLDKNVLFINIHGLNRTSTKKFIRQMVQIEERIKDYSGAIIFGGDFNTRNKDRTNYFKDWSVRNGFSIVTFPNDPRQKVLDYITTRGISLKHAHLYSDVTTSDHTAMGIEFN